MLRRRTIIELVEEVLVVMLVVVVLVVEVIVLIVVIVVVVVVLLLSSTSSGYSSGISGLVMSMHGVFPESQGVVTRCRGGRRVLLLFISGKWGLVVPLEDMAK